MLPRDGGEPLHARADLRGLAVGDERRPPHAAPLSRRLRRSSAGRHRGPRALRSRSGGRRTPGSPSVPGEPESTTPATRAPHALAASQNSRRTRRCTSGSRTTPFGASARPASNCGLTRTSASQPGAASAMAGGSTRVAEMNETSQVIDSRREGQLVQMTRVDPLEHVRAVVVAESRMELPVADVQRDHARRAPLEQAVRESARRRAEVEAASPGRVDAERVERVCELLAAARDEPRRALDGEHHVLPDLLPRLVEPRNEPREDEGLSLSAALGEPALDEHDVEALLGQGTDGRTRRWRPATSARDPDRRRARHRRVADVRARAARGSRVAHRRDRLRGGRVPPVLGRALAEQPRARRARRDARSRRATRARARLRSRSSLPGRGAPRRGGGRHRLGGRRDRAPGAERSAQPRDSHRRDRGLARARALHRLGPFDLVLAADVLYEERNAEPILALLEASARRGDRRPGTPPRVGASSTPPGAAAGRVETVRRRGSRPAGSIGCPASGRPDGERVDDLREDRRVGVDRLEPRVRAAGGVRGDIPGAIDAERGR